MRHRHLNHQDFTLAAIDDVIARGRLSDWERLREAVRADAEVRENVRKVCGPKLGDSYAQRYHFWNRYAGERKAS
jgi:hypothetical protein